MPSRFEFEREIRRSGLPPLARLIALVIATWADAGTGVIARKNQPAQSVLMEATGMSKSAFLTHRKALLDQGWVRCVSPDKIKAQKEHAQNVYSIHIPDGWARSGGDLAFLGEVGHGVVPPRSGDDPAKSDKSESTDKARSSGDPALSDKTAKAGSGDDLAKTDQVRIAPEKLGRLPTTRVFPSSSVSSYLPAEESGQTASNGEERIPDAFAFIQPLIHAMTDAGFNTLSWQMQADDIQSIARVLKRAGVKAMVDFALETKTASHKRIRFATFFLRGGWLGLPPKSTSPRPAPNRDPQADWPEWCKDPDCDEITRRRRVEDSTGIRTLVRCQQCHPDRKESAA
jgi:hypothetical protein